MENERRNLRLGAKYRGKGMSEESALIVNQLQKIEGSVEKLEGTVEKRFDTLQAVVEKIEDRTVENEKCITNHETRLNHIEKTRDEDRETFRDNFTIQYGRIETLEKSVASSAGATEIKQKSTPNIIAIIAVCTTVIMGIIIFLLQNGGA